MAVRAPITGTRNGLEIVEEAVHLLRRAPVRVWALYLIGALPFCLAFAYFVADMSRSAFASEQLIESSLLLAMTFQWKHCWQAAFSSEIYAMLEGNRLPWTLNRVRRMTALQCALQPFSLVALPLAAITAFPLPYVMGLFRNVTLFAGLNRERRLTLARSSSGLWTAQAWTALGVFALLSLLLFVNYLVTLALIPQLLKSFFGLENSVTRYGGWVLNSTVMIATGMLVYLSLDPLMDAVYVLRCFYGESIATGTDLRAGLRRALSTAAVLCFLLLVPVAPISAQEPVPHPVPAAGIDQEKLKKSIEEVVRRREFTWRSPKTISEREDSKFVGWLKSVWRSITQFWDWLTKQIRNFFFPDSPGSEVSEGNGRSAAVVRWILFALGIGFVLLIVYIFYRQRKASGKRIQAKPVAAAPVIDLRDESVTADQLPEDSWFALAHEWIDKGDYRLALRAMYLGAISHLGHRNLVGIQRWKSGLDYSRELSRKTRATPEVAPAFSRAVRTFESGWYGRHTVDRGTLDEFAAGFEEVRRGAR